jgi:hypothetical protein
MVEPRRRGRLVAEVVAIVLSILAAFAIDAWWDGQQEVAEAAEILDGLTEEFTENAELIDETLALSLRGRSGLQRFIASSPEELASTAPQLGLDEVYEPFIRTWSVSPTVGFLRATINSGKLALVEDTDLRAALARFDGIQADVSEVLWYTNELNLEAAKLLGAFDDVRTFLAQTEGLTADILAEGRLSGETLGRMRSDEQLMNISAAKLRYWDGYLLEVRALRENVTEILILLDRERSQL